MSQDKYTRLSWSGNLSKAVTSDEFKFLGLNKRGFTEQDLEQNIMDHKIQHFRVKWRLQKNNDNGQEIDFAQDSENPKYYCLLAALQIYRRSQCLGMKLQHPMGFFYEKPGENSKKGGVKFVTDKLVAVHLRTCASIVLNIKKNDP